MKTVAQVVGVLSGIAVLLSFALAFSGRHVEAQSPHPVIVPVPVPSDTPRMKKRLPRRFGEPAPDGTEPAIDFPMDLWFRNINSPRGGDGMCVATSWEFIAVYNGLPFKGFRDWAGNKEPGGGWPAKLARQVAEWCKAKNVPPSVFDPKKHLIQYEGSDFGFVETALRNGWPCGMSLFHSPRYSEGTIYHMTVCLHIDPEGKQGTRYGCIQDNNFREPEWSTLEEFKRRVMGRDPNTGKMQFWAFVAVAPGPPPAPCN